MLNQTFLKILKHALRGEKATDCEALTTDQWKRLFAMAKIHSVVPMFYEAVYDVPVIKEQMAEFVLLTKRKVIQQVMTQTMKTADFLAVNQKLQEAGIKALVVKGLVCRNLYPHPDHRPSGDEDILIPAEQFALCHQVMTECGMTTEFEAAKMQTAYEVPYRKTSSPLHIELHKYLFPPTSEAYGYMNYFFVDAFEKAIPMEIQGHTVYTLDYTENMFYMICHALKHFLHSGFGIRQVCDIVMFANEYGSQIDWEKVLRNCRAVNGEGFAAALFKIGQKYLTFEPDKACWTESWKSMDVDEEPMLKDLLSGGLYGDASMSRKHSSNITLDAAKSQQKGKKTKYSMNAALFPAREALEDRYSYLKKHPYLLPVAWTSRVISYANEKPMKKNNNAMASLKIGHDRVKLMEKYGIIKDGKRRK